MASMSPNPFTIPLEKSATALEASPRSIWAPSPPEAVVPAAPESVAATCGTWAEEPSSPDVSASIRDAVRKVRQAGLARVVKSVTLASAILCLAAVARTAISAGSHGGDEIAHTARITMKEEPVHATFVTVHDDGDPVHAHVAARPPRVRRRPPSSRGGAR
jgi:hypothetical protein